MGAITTTLNWTALIGWTVVAVMTVFLHLSGDDTPSGELMKITLFCELICASETLKIAAGLLRGDLALSFTVHYTRLLMYFVTMPHSEVSTTVVKMILLAWSLTEMFRYPMVLFPEVSTAPKLLPGATRRATFQFILVLIRPVLVPRLVGRRFHC